LYAAPGAAREGPPHQPRGRQRRERARRRDRPLHPRRAARARPGSRLVSDREQDARRERLTKLRAAGVEPYPARTDPHTRIAELRRLHDAASAEQLAATTVRAAVAGRIRSRRSFGKLLFLTLVEDGSALQLSARKGETDAAAFAFLAELDVG